MKVKKIEDQTIYVDDDTENVYTILKLRITPLFIGLFLGFVISFITSQFEDVLARNIRAAFFLPFVVYIADAIGAQTSSIYTRDLQSGKTTFHNYLVKESLLGIIFGVIFGLISGVIIRLWFKDELLALSVGTATLIAVSTAPLVGLLVAQGSALLKKDPAAEAGPIATVVQDMLSVIIYGAVCSAIIL